MAYFVSFFVSSNISIEKRACLLYLISKPDLNKDIIIGHYGLESGINK